MSNIQRSGGGVADSTFLYPFLCFVMILRCSPKRAIGQYKDHVTKKGVELKNGLFCSFATESLSKSIVEVEKQS